MAYDIIFSGFGGQGALFAGQLLAYAAMDAGKQVTWMPSYGPEMRGGTANCTVIVSDDEIGSPLVSKPGAGVILNLPSLDKYGPRLASNGVLVVNASLINREVKRPDLQAVMIPAQEIAETIGNRRLTNIVMLGALLQKYPILPVEAIEQALDTHLPERHRKMLPLNIQALRHGAAFARGEAVTA